MHNQPFSSQIDTGHKKPRLILASASPRRRELLALLGYPFRIVTTDAEEDEHLPPEPVRRDLPFCPVSLHDHPTLRAWRKAGAVLPQVDAELVLGADTIVVLDDQVLNKPRDAADARAMLRRLAGHEHQVFTGLCLARRNDQSEATFLLDLVSSRVEIAALDAAQIDDYVATGEPLDKAGAYGIQGLGGRLVRQVIGSYTAVVGLPLPATHQLLAEAGIAGLCDPAAAYQEWLNSQGKELLPWPPTLP